MKLSIVILLLMLTSQVSARPLMIAHAGGGIDGQNYSNSLEALDLNYAKGYRYFEIDFSWTSDGELVCLHDWDKQFKKVFGFKIKQPLSSVEFEGLLKTTDGLHPCTLDTLNLWMKNHTDVKIITDVKLDNLKAIKKISQVHPQLLKHFIPQFYQPAEYQLLKTMGFKQLIWILYQYEGKLSSVPTHVKHMDLLSISMRGSQAKKKFARKLITNGENIFVYTVNDEKKLKNLVKKYQISGIYTDFLDSVDSESEL